MQLQQLQLVGRNNKYNLLRLSAHKSTFTNCYSRSVTTTTRPTPVSTTTPGGSFPFPWTVKNGYDCVSSLFSVLRIGKAKTKTLCLSLILLSVRLTPDRCAALLITEHHRRCAMTGEEVDGRGRHKAFDKWPAAKCQVGQLVCAKRA